MTYKIFGILKRPDGMTFEQFKTWWVEVHVPRVMKWPNIFIVLSGASRQAANGAIRQAAESAPGQPKKAAD